MSAFKITTDRTTWCIVLALVLICAGAWLNRRLFDDPASPLDQGRFYILKVHAPPVYDMVMSGNSRVLQALSPEAMAESLPDLQILNFGLDGACLTPQMLAEIEGKLNPTAQSPAILLGIEPGTLELYSSHNRKLNIELNRSREAVFIARHGGAWSRWFEPVRPFAVANRARIWTQGPTTQNPRYINEYHPDGWMAASVFPENPAAVENEYRSKIDAIKPDAPRAPLPFGDIVLEQVRQWSDRGIKVFGSRMPTHPLVREYENKAFDFDEQEYARKFEAAGGVWLAFSQEAYRTYDGSHLDKAYAIQFSRAVAKAIKINLP